jgi:hypothetical protein
MSGKKPFSENAFWNILLFLIFFLIKNKITTTMVQDFKKIAGVECMNL